jgi:hypothetical protein
LVPAAIAHVAVSLWPYPDKRQDNRRPGQHF